MHADTVGVTFLGANVFAGKCLHVVIVPHHLLAFNFVVAEREAAFILSIYGRDSECASGVFVVIVVNAVDNFFNDRSVIIVVLLVIIVIVFGGLGSAVRATSGSGQSDSSKREENKQCKTHG